MFNASLDALRERVCSQGGQKGETLLVESVVCIVQFEHQTCFTQAAKVRCSLTCVDLTQFTRVILIRNSRLPTTKIPVVPGHKAREKANFEPLPLRDSMVHTGGLYGKGKLPCGPKKNRTNLNHARKKSDIDF